MAFFRFVLLLVFHATTLILALDCDQYWSVVVVNETAKVGDIFMNTSAPDIKGLISVFCNFFRWNNYAKSPREKLSLRAQPEGKFPTSRGADGVIIFPKKVT